MTALRCFRMFVWSLAMGVATTGYGAVGAGGDQPMVPAAALFEDNCAQCHDGSVPRAPHVMSFTMMSTPSIISAMTDGVMRQQAAHLTPDQRRQIAEYLSGARVGTPYDVLFCDAGQKISLDRQISSWSSWGGDLSNSRFQPMALGGISTASLDDLTLRWAFAYSGATRARSQPLVHGRTVFVGSQQGEVYALDLDSGCAHWRYDAGAEVRNGLAIARLTGVPEPVVFFGDFKARVHAVSAKTGRALWQSDVGTHPDATITGSVKYHEDRVYVPISSSEWATAADPGYACCSFRGSVASLDALSGKVIWNSFVIPEEPAETGAVNSAGANQIAPAGAPVWNSPTIDSDRGLLYVGTGEDYSSPASQYSDAVIAINLETGAIVWTRQLLGGDAWNLACFIGGGGNCPEENGPDLDIGASVVLWRGERRDLLLVGQKSGDVYALDPDVAGSIVWQRKLGRGGFAGGVHWGMSANSTTLFVPIADTYFPGVPEGDPFPGLHALDPESGKLKWYTPALERCPEALKPTCDPGLSAAITSSETLVFAGGYDGMLQVYDARSGNVVWQFNSRDEFETVSGELARGGSIESDGPVVGGGYLLVNSGYQWGNRLPGNVLLVFGPASNRVAIGPGGE